MLNDPEKREMYDRYGSSFETRGAGRPGAAGAWGAGPGGVSFEDFDFSQVFGEQPGGQAGGGGFGDFFSQFRRAGGRERSTAPESPRRGQDIRHEVQIPFNTSITGGEVQVTVRRQTGKTESISVKIPPGIEDGKKIRVRGQGEPGPHGDTPGDILITVHVPPHTCFQRRGNHLHVKVPVTLSEAALGAKVDLPTPQGTISLTVPPGTSGGDKLRVKGHGVRPKNAAAGDLFAEIQIVLPDQLSEADRIWIRELGDRHPQDPRTNLKW